MVALVLLLLAEGLAEAQPQPPRDRPPAPTVGTALIRGHVIDGATGLPVPRARVRLQGPAPRPAILTDVSGAFEFTKLPAAPYTVVADKSTYLPGRHPDPERSLRAMRQTLTLRDGQLIENITLKVFRSGVIAGRVVDAYGDPVESAELRVVSAARAGSRVTLRGGWQTNDLGEFRVSGLPAGRYLVAALPPRNFFVDESSMANAQPLPEPLPTYYPGAVAQDQAQPLTLGKGQAVIGIEIVMAEGTPTLVSGVVVSRDGSPVTSGGGVTARSVATESLPGSSVRGGGIRGDGTFRMKLSPGEYILDAHVSLPAAGPRQGENEQFGTARVSVGTEALEGISIVIGRGASASGRVIFEGTTPPPNNPGKVRLPLYSEDAQLCRAGEAALAPDWSFRVAGLFGTCTAPMQSMFGRWNLKAVMHRGQDLLQRPLTFEAGQRFSDVQIVFTDRRTELTLGVTGEDGQPTRNYVAIVFSADKERWKQHGRYLQTYVPPTDEQVMRATRRPATSSTPRAAAVPPSQITRQVMSGLQPGDYYAIAIDDIEGEASRDPAVLERLISSATRVAVSYDAPASVALRRITLSDVVR